MSEILRPCPFCGSADIRTEPGINLNYCDKCSAEANIEHWNTRPIEDALRARIAELEEEIDQLTSHSNIERQDDKWIPVSERLPEDLQSIIVFTKDRKTYIIRFLELYGREGFGSLSDIVTHWMPLPVLPESPNDTQSSTIVYGKEGEE